MPSGSGCEPMANSDRPTIIEKYANRRLYNTGTYTFVTVSYTHLTLPTIYSV